MGKKATKNSSLLESLVHSLDLAVIVVDKDRRVVLMNPAAGQLTGCVAAEARDVSIGDVLGLEPEACDAVCPETAGGTPPDEAWHEAVCYLKEDPRRPAKVRRKDLALPDGSPGTVLVIEGAGRDMEQKGLAYALEAAEERFNVLFRESSDPILILSMGGEILSANDAFERISGTRSEELFSGERTWEDFVYPDDLSALLDTIKRCSQWERDQTVEFRMKSDIGPPVWFEQSHSILHDERGNARGIVAVARDITRRKQLEEELRQQAQLMQHKHRRAQELIAKLTRFFTKINELPADIDGFLNGVADILFDMYRPLLVCITIPRTNRVVYQAGTHFPSTVLNAQGQPEPFAMCADVMANGSPFYSNALLETEPYCQNPTVKELGLQTYLGTPLRDSTGRIRGTLALVDTQSRVFDHLDIELFTVAALHVASRLRGEEQEGVKRELEDHLRQAQKMEAVGMLAGGIAHDFNNILSGILGFSSYLLSKVEPTSDFHRHLGLIEQSAMQASELTRQLLAFSRRTHFDKEPVLLHQVIREVVSILQHSLPKDIHIEQEMVEDLPPVLGDRGQLTQVIMNLCLNASDAMAAKGGRLTLATECRSLTSRERAVMYETEEGEYVCVTVRDTGIGMDAEVQEHIFDPFFTTKSDRGGTGLGLSIVYGIVTNHGGDIQVESAEGEGSTFHVYFPVHRGEKREEKKVRRRQLRGTETVLIVEDETIVSQMVAEVLKDHGYKPVCAASGEEAVKILQKKNGEIDLVLLDMIMPGMDGEETFYALREINGEVPILLTSGFAQGERCAALIAQGAKDLVRKPYRSQDLLAHIREALGDAPPKEAGETPVEAG